MCFYSCKNLKQTNNIVQRHTELKIKRKGRKAKKERKRAPANCLEEEISEKPEITIAVLILVMYINVHMA